MLFDRDADPEETQGDAYPIRQEITSSEWYVPELATDYFFSSRTRELSGPGGEMDIGNIVDTAGRGLDHVGQFIGSIGDLADSLPGSSLDSFKRRIYSPMLAQAQATGRPVDAFWFGEIVRVQPSGAYAITSRPVTVDAALAYWRNLAERESFYTINCDQAQELGVGCSFQKWGSWLPDIPGLTPSGAGFSLASLGLLAGLALVAWKIFK